VFPFWSCNETATLPQKNAEVDLPPIEGLPIRFLFAMSVTALFLSACASQTTQPATAAASTPAVAAAAPKAPRWWNCDAGKFEAVGVKTRISGVEVICKPTSDGKNAQRMGAGH
jgi:hypothetical protein